ncbi:MAG: hypothetical protein M1383_02655 [Patescibacteria group bacterium]|nr:hypothetical protein [Patescibacteria group bacterium]
MSRKYGTLSSEFLKAVGEATGLFRWPLEYSASWRYEQLYGSRKKFQNTVSSLKRQGFIKMIRKRDEKFIKLTSKGELELLIQKAGVKKIDKWDGKWRLLIFDIPEKAREKRDLLRGLLKRNNFAKLQASVFVSPYPLNREAVTYIKTVGLVDYIRLLKVEEINDDQNLKKHFGLK